MSRRLRGVLVALLTGMLVGLLLSLCWQSGTSKAQQSYPPPLGYTPMPDPPVAPLATPTPAPWPCDYGFAGSWQPYCLHYPDPSITVRSVGYGDGSVHYSVCIWGRPGLVLDVLGVWTELRTKERQHMPEAQRWRIVALSEEHCEQRQWFAAWPGGLYVMDLVELRYKWWAPWT